MSRYRCLASGVGGIALLFVWLAFFRANQTETAAAWQESNSLLGDGQAISALAFSPDSQRLAAGDFDGNLFVWELPSGRRLASFQSHHLRIRSLAFSPDGKMLATASSDDSVKLWSLVRRPTSESTAETLEEIHTLLGHEACVVALGFAPDGRNLITGSGDGVVKLWNTATGRERASWLAHKPEQGVTSLACSPDGQTLATAGLDRTVKLWNLANGRELVSLTQPAAVHALAFSGDGKSLITANRDGAIHFWDTATHQATETLSATGGIILSLAVTADGRKLFSASLEGAVNLWDLDVGRTPFKFDLGGQLIRAVAFSPGYGQFAFAAVGSNSRESDRPDQRDFAVKIWGLLPSQKSGIRVQ
jgi:WD40 repeat protein